MSRIVATSMAVKLCLAYVLSITGPACASEPGDSTRLTTKANWPHLRGNDYSAVSSERGLAESWPDAGPPVLWTADVGIGYSAIVIADNLAYTQGQGLSDQSVRCINATNGELVWEFSYGWPYEASGMYPGPRATPTYDDGRLYFAGPYGYLGCLDAKSGKRIWSLNVLKTFQGRGSGFGYSCSPLIEEELLILPVGGKGASVVALDKETGDVVWKSGDEPSSYCSALPVDLNGERQIVVFLQNALAAFELKTGKLLWQIEYSQGYDEHAAFPLYHEPLLIVASPFRDGARCYDLSQFSTKPEMDGTGKLPKLVWQSGKMSNDVSSSVLVGQYIYGFDLRDIQAKLHRPSRGEFRCLDLQTGSVRWSSEKTGHVSLIAADGKLLMLSDAGELILARSNHQRYDELARTKVFAGPACWTPPTLSEGRLFLRHHDRAVCLYIGLPEKLSREQRSVTQRVANISRRRSIDYSVLIGGEREYPFDLLTREEFTLWYAYCLLGVLIPASVVGSAVNFACHRIGFANARLVSHTFFWTIAIILGIVATPLINSQSTEFVCTWPVVLFAGFQLSIAASSVAVGEGDRRRQKGMARITGLVFLLLCAAFFQVCRTTSLIMAWVFLAAFIVAFPFAIVLGRRLKKSGWFSIDLVWVFVAFSAYFWGAALFTFAKAHLSG